MDPESTRELRHELRTPVNHLIGYAELLLDEPDIPPAARERLVEVREIARRVLDATAGLLGDNAEISGQSANHLQVLVGELETSTAAAAAELPEACQEDAARLTTATGRLRALVATLGGSPVHGAGERPDTGHPAAPTQDEGDTILVVDDDEANRDVLARRLVRLGYRVEQATNGREALDVLAARPIDLVLLDLMMPEMDGYAVLEHRRGDPALRDIPVVMISAIDQVESIARCIEQGAEDYLPKPFDPVLLKARVGACLEKKKLRDAEKRLLQTITTQAEQLREWNEQLEARVQEKVQEIERLGKLQRFVAPQLAEILMSGGEGVLESHRQEIAVLFCDLRGYTSFSETAEPEDVMAVLRELHAALVPLVFTHQGTLAQFTGDGMMVIFNDPIPCDAPALRAVGLGVEMIRRSTELAEGWRRRGHGLEMGAGVALGYATCGRIGYEGRFEYTAIGTVVNLAGRLCGEAKGGQLLVSERVHGAVDGRYPTNSAGELALKGFTRPVPAYSVG